MSNTVNEKLFKNCEIALETLKKVNDPDTTELQTKLEWCVGSFSFDGNPVGLHEFGVVALQTLKDIKNENPKKVTKKVIDDLEKSIASYEAAR